MMSSPKFALVQIVQSRAEASGYLKSPGDAVLIQRGRPRWLLLLCPCGCGDELPINLDSRAGPAWRIYGHKKNGTSVYPSVWRDTGCGSHFIIWRDRILLFGQGDDFLSSGPVDEVATLKARVSAQLPLAGFVTYVAIADALSEVPWDVLKVCRQLVRAGIAREGRGKQRGTFARI